MFRVNGSHWLVPNEQTEAIIAMVENGIIKWDNKRSLPLKKGGTTDVYINLRDMRSHPELVDYLAKLYANPVQRLRVDRLVEVPDAVSPLAGHLSVITGKPLVTIREEAKPGRVTKGKLIGEIKRGDRVVIIDDVVTDGASKIAPLVELRSVGAVVVAIIVMVDRQQGWQKKLAEAGFGDVEVWSGMTLHHVRRHLVETKLMERCDPEIEKNNPLIVAYDGKPPEEVFSYLDLLRPAGCIAKVNDMSLTGNINEVIADLSVYARVMYDPKWHDIPKTVTNDCKRLRKTPPWAVTVHASGGSEMVKAAVEGMAGTPTIVLAVTLLTSIGSECDKIFCRQPIDQVMKLAELAYDAGARGFVCSAEEAAILRKKYSDAVIVIPGLRSPGKDAHEQKRIGTFIGAKEVGGNFFVGGRQFLESADPVAEIFRVLKEELGVELPTGK
ncbi:MAG: orotidine-5'-phosphate decarboxylase [Patescibacteria group bacterium]|nr:orotidine-5'-phosphate decarboxylase [Patescibacteria group bacterium]